MTPDIWPDARRCIQAKKPRIRAKGKMIESSDNRPLCWGVSKVYSTLLSLRRTSRSCGFSAGPVDVKVLSPSPLKVPSILPVVLSQVMDFTLSCLTWATSWSYRSSSEGASALEKYNTEPMTIASRTNIDQLGSLPPRKPLGDEPPEP